MGMGRAGLTIGREYGIMGLHRKSPRINDLQQHERYDILRARPSCSELLRPHPTCVSPKGDTFS